MKTSNENEPRKHMLERIITEVSVSRTDQRPAGNADEQFFYQVRAAHKFGYSEPFSNEQMALNTMLSAINATKEQTEKAWGLFQTYSRSE